MAIIAVGDRVTIKRTKHQIEGEVKFIGSIQAKAGIFYGVELDDCKGETDGSKHNTPYFKCDPNKGLFVTKASIIKITPNKHLFKRRNTIGDKITVQKAGCTGVIRYIGIPYSFNQEDVFYGIHLDKPKGDSNGTVNQRWFFTTPNNYAIFIKCPKKPRPKTPPPPPPPIYPPELKDGDLCFIQANDVTINNCCSLLRLCSALKYYQQLNIRKNALVYGNGQLLLKTKQILVADQMDDEFCKFCNDVYHELLEDYTHLITRHSHQLEDICVDLIENHAFKPCNVNKCEMTKRHYNRINRQTKKDPKFKFYRETFDGLHFFLFHLFDVGLRIGRNDINKENTPLPSGSIYHFNADYSFTRRLSSILKKKASFTIIKSKFNKYKFNYVVRELITIYDKKNKGTFVDTMWKHIKGKIKARKQLYYFLNNECFDTDSINADINIRQQNSEKSSNILNMLKQLQYKRCYGSIIEFVTDRQLSAVSFSTGIDFYYWPYYKNLQNKNKMQSQVNESNINDHSGHQIEYLYVAKKFDTFQKEIYAHHIPKSEYDQVMVKTRKYISTPQVKKIKMLDWVEAELHYGIYRKNTKLSKSHIQSIIWYCDFSELQTKFSESFRQIYTAESLADIKKRNRMFWWMSKLLRETIQYFGIHGPEARGPFYCGVNAVMCVPEFCIRLCSPTSASVQEEVSMNFSDVDGMIIQLINNSHIDSHRLRLFDCSWISKYKEEDERIFVGGDYRIRIESIILMRTTQNFEMFCHAFYVFDCMINGTNMAFSGIKFTPADKEIMEGLLNGDTMFEDDNYIKYTFRLFCCNKKQIVVNMYYLDLYFKTEKLSSLLMHSVQNTDDQNNTPKSMRNVFRKDRLKLFKNVKDIIIYTACFWGDDGRHKYIYSLSTKSLMSLVDSLMTSSCSTITIKAAFTKNGFGKPQPSWIRNLWNRSGKSIKSKCEKKKCTIRLSNKPTRNIHGYSEDCLIIQRKKF